MSDFDIHQKHLRLGGDKGHLGKAVGNQAIQPCPDGKGSFLELERGAIYEGPDTGVHEVRGPILKKWREFDPNISVLGYPISDDRLMSDGAGRYSEFERGVIFWSKATDAHVVQGAILSKYRMLKGPRGVLGYPTSDEADTSDNRGKFNTFEHGSIHWRGETSAFAVHGEIHDKWVARGGATATVAPAGAPGPPLGFPLSDELPNPNLNTRFNLFEKGTLSRVVSGQPPAGLPIPAPTQVRHAHDRTADQLTSANKTHAGDGFRIRSLSIYGDPANPLYACVWVKDIGPQQRMTLKVSSGGVRAFLDDPANDGFVPAMVSATGPAGNAVFALVYEKRSGPSPVLRLDLVAGPIAGLNHPATFNYWCQWARGNHHVLTSASIYGDEQSPRYVGIWELDKDEVPWNVAYHTGSRKIACNFMPENDPELFEDGEMDDIQKAQGFWAMPTFVTRSPDGRALRVFRPGGKGTWALRSNRKRPDYESDLADFEKKDFHPMCVQGTRVGNESRFTVIFSKHPKPPQRKLTITGVPAPSLIAFDEAMGEMMKATGARAASLAIAKGGKLRYARAFTWAEPSAPPVQPKDLFRIASCSKPITAVGIYQLAEDGVLTLLSNPPAGATMLEKTLPNTLVNNVTLSLPPSRPMAEGINAITLKQLLRHRAGLQKPVEHDETILDAFNEITFAPHTLPMTLLKVASYMATVPREFTDGKEHYSNVGFLFLSLVIEQKTGKPYAQAIGEKIFTPVGVTRAQLTASTTTLADGEVIALDRHLRVGRSVMEPARPIVPHEYGTVNRIARAGQGGWAISAAEYVRFLSVLHSGKGTLLDDTTVKSDERLKKHGGSHDGAVAHIEHMGMGTATGLDDVTFAVFFAINFFGEFEQRIKDIINALPNTAWPAIDLFPDLLS